MTRPKFIPPAFILPDWEKPATERQRRRIASVHRDVLPRARGGWAEQALSAPIGRRVCKHCGGPHDYRRCQTPIKRSSGWIRLLYGRGSRGKSDSPSSAKATRSASLACARVNTTTSVRGLPTLRINLLRSSVGTPARPT